MTLNVLYLLCENSPACITSSFKSLEIVKVPEFQQGPEKSKWKRGTIIGNESKEIEDIYTDVLSWLYVPSKIVQ